MNAPIKTPQQIQDLKDEWHRDPCWDIEDTDGFEAHREELAAYRIESDAKWTAEHNARIEADMLRSGITDPAVYRWLAALEARVQALEDNA